MNKREKKERLARIVEILKEIYPDATCALEYGSDPWRLLVMGRLSAQCTDARVNLVCKDLFERYPTPEALSTAPLCDIEEIIKPCGLYRMKAKNIQDATIRLLEVYGGVLPSTMEELLTFEGVGRKIANLLLGDIYHLPAVVTDTHCIRICGRWGLYPEREKRPYEVEKILVSLIDPQESSDFCHRVVLFGRDRCMARGPLCHGCPIGEQGLCAKRTREMSHDR